MFKSCNTSEIIRNVGQVATPSQTSITKQKHLCKYKNTADAASQDHCCERTSTNYKLSRSILGVRLFTRAKH